MEGAISEQTPVELHHEIDYDNTEFDTGNTQGDAFDFDIGDGNNGQDEHLEAQPGNAAESTDPANDHDADAYGEAHKVAQEGNLGNDAEVLNDASEHEIDFDHDDIGESLHVSAADEEMDDLLAQEGQAANGVNEDYEEVDYEDGHDVEATGQVGNTADEAPTELGEGTQGGAADEGDISHTAFIAPRVDSFDGNDQAITTELDTNGGTALPEAQSHDPFNDEYDESAYSMEDGNLYNNQDFATAQPDVTFCYRHDEYSLFAESPDDDPNTYFLADTEALNQPLCDFLTKIRGIIAGELSTQDEIVLRVDGLGLEFGETTTRDFLDRTTFGQIIDLHDRLVKLDNAEASRNLYVYLITRPNCLDRFGELTSGVTDGKGLSTFERYFDPPSPVVDAPGDESHEISPEEEALGDSMTDSHFSAADNTGEDDHVEQPVEEVATVEVIQTDPEHDIAEFSGENFDEAIQVTHTEFYEGDEGFDAPEQDGAADHPTEIGDEFLQNLDQGHEEVLAESGIDSTWTETAEIDLHHPENPQENDKAEENGVVNAYQEEELFDYDDNEEFDDQVEIQNTDRGEEAALDAQIDASSTLAQANESGLGQHEIDYAAAEGFLETDASAEVTTMPSNLPDTTNQDLPLDVAPSGTPLPVSDNTSASNTLNGEEIDFDDDVTAAPAVTVSMTDAQNSLDTVVDEIDWDHDEDEILDGNETNLTMSSNSAKRSRQLDTEAGADDENDVKRRRT